MKVVNSSFVVLLLILSSCAKQMVVPHPNQINTFDGYAYDTLMTAQAAINSAKQDVTTYPAIKQPLNQAITVYNTTEAAYKVYHEGGKLDPTVEAQLGQALQQLVAAVTQVVQARGTK